MHSGSLASKAGNLPFGELCSPEAQNRTNWRTAASTADRRQSPTLTASERDTPSACVDIQSSPKTDVLLFIINRLDNVMLGGAYDGCKASPVGQEGHVIYCTAVGLQQQQQQQQQHKSQHTVYTRV